MRFILPVLVLLFALCTSCEKEPLSFIIEGQLIEVNSDKAISNVTVNLFQKEYISGVLNTNYTFIGAVNTDADGKYKFEIDRVRIFEIKIEIDDPNYYDKTSIYPSSKLSSETPSIFDEYLEARSWVTISLNNPFVGFEEQMNIYKTKFKADCEGCCENGSSSFTEQGDTSFTCATTGGSEVIIDYGLTGSSAQLRKTITCVPFDTVFVEINY